MNAGNFYLRFFVFLSYLFLLMKGGKMEDCIEVDLF